ncbi:hypothetical protein AG1IA_00644 [Rhizoctonia solani AG-1 IA]|uniref:Uncharacterized protein n=1 Tax=Thanatephorus cucumeris (strain AG1-IA) TaxID=983506 RepID=L8X4V7_THACA|nr:hypothetical protein AG1IA_00644 [Rhizoctonia solani AG-1 IA]
MVSATNFYDKTLVARLTGFRMHSYQSLPGLSIGFQTGRAGRFKLQIVPSKISSAIVSRSIKPEDYPGTRAPNDLGQVTPVTDLTTTMYYPIYLTLSLCKAFDSANCSSICRIFANSDLSRWRKRPDSGNNTSKHKITSEYMWGQLWTPVSESDLLIVINAQIWTVFSPADQ